MKNFFKTYFESAYYWWSIFLMAFIACWIGGLLH
jgi:hypothetical protein